MTAEKEGKILPNRSTREKGLADSNKSLIQ